MNPTVLRTLEDWSTHQDYFWFLAVLAWGAVVAAELRREDHTGVVVARGWLVGLACAQIAGALLELVLLAQDLQVPYTRFDLAMGFAQAAGAFALVWGATTAVPGARVWRGFAAAVLSGLAVARYRWPLEAGAGLGLVQAVALLGLLRRRAGDISRLAAGVLLLAPIVATHGPWAYAIRQGRRTTDWSHFSLAAAALVVTAGLLLAAAGWRNRLQQAIVGATPGGTLRRDLQRAGWLLAIWLGCGVLLAVWYGRQARRAYEESLLRRVEMAALVLDPAAVAEALSPELRIESIEQRRAADGQLVGVATVPRTQLPVYAALRAKIGHLREKNPDIKLLNVSTWRDGHLLILRSGARSGEGITHLIHHEFGPDDQAHLDAGASFLEGPIVSQFGAKLAARVPLKHPATGEFLGWLNAEVDSTRWAATFTQARLQTMALVGAGVGLWGVAVAHRLRRESRDAAERRAAAAAAADRMKSAFLAKVSHELRTPIQSVLGYGELLAGAPLAEPHRAWLAALRSHGGIMLRLVNDLIDLGALQSGAFQLTPAPVALHPLIDDCAAALRPAASARGLEFQVDVEAGVPSWVHVDGIRLRQVLLNLLTNAVKFTPAGRVTLTVRAVADGAVEFAVTDTGPGIPVAERPRLFQPFARLDPAATEGSGLGLALVQGLCTVMGGSVRLEENNTPGATFVARLPLPRCEPPATSLGDPALMAPRLRGLKVLVAEDNTLVRELLVAFLAGNGAEVTVAVDGPAALARARERAPDVVLLDIALPRLDGIAVAEALRREGPAALRIVGLSAHAGPRDEARAKNAGMDVFLAKPVSLPRLAQVLTNSVPRAQLAAVISLLAGKIPDDGLRARLVAQFESETPRVLAEMRAALAAADWTRLRRGAHYLKNSADVLGAVTLQDACARLAALADPPGPASARELFVAVEAAIASPVFVSADVVQVDAR